MGAIPNKLPGFQDIVRDVEARKRFETAWGREILPRYGWHLSGMFEAMERGELTTVYCIGENPANSEADSQHATKLLENLDTLIVQDIVMTRTAEIADVVLPAANAAFESEGTVTNSERRVQRVRKALDPPGNAMDDIWIIAQLAKRLGYDWGELTAHEAWDELRSLSPMHRGMTWTRLDSMRGAQWPCWDEDHPGTQYLHARLWEDDPEKRLRAAPFSVVVDEPPVDELTPEYPIRLTTGRRLDSYNTGVQTAAYTSPLRRPEAVELSADDAEALGVEEGERVLVSSRRGEVVAPVSISSALRAGLAFMSIHFPDQVETNRLTIDATDPKSGTAEFKATAIRIEKLPTDAVASDRWGRGVTGGSSDLHLMVAVASEEERAAVDDALGPPPDGSSDRVVRGGHGTRELRTRLLPTLHALQGRVGWISEGGLNYVCERLGVPPADAYGVATFYAMFSVQPRPKTVVHVCDDLACRVNGAGELLDRLTAEDGPRGLDVDPEPVPRDVRTGPRDPGTAGRGAGRCARRRDHPGGARGRRAGRRGHVLGGRYRAADLGRTDPREAASPRPGRPRRSALDQRLPAPRRIRGVASRDRARTRRDDPGGIRRQAPGARRCRVPGRGEMEGGFGAARSTPLRGLQCRRIRARHVQGSAA